MPITYRGLASLAVRGGTGTNFFFVASTPVDTAVTLYGGKGGTSKKLFLNDSDARDVEG